MSRPISKGRERHRLNTHMLKTKDFWHLLKTLEIKKRDIANYPVIIPQKSPVRLQPRDAVL